MNENRTGSPKIPSSAIKKAEKTICKIIINETVNENKESIGTGFFMLVNNIIYLITNYHNINENSINKKITIQLFNYKKINMKFSIRDIKYFQNLDITMIEIKNTDEIIKYIEYLEYDLNYIIGYKQYLKAELFTAEYPKDEIEFASGKIIEILYDDIYKFYEFKHNIDTEPGSSGSPIILLHTLKVIGIHKQGDRDMNSPINYGTFIGEIFNENNNNNLMKVSSKIKDLEISQNNYNSNVISQSQLVEINTFHHSSSNLITYYFLLIHF